MRSKMNKQLINSWQGGNKKEIDLTNLNIDGYKIDNNSATFLGKRYEKVFKPLTGLSLYNVLSNEDVLKSSKLLKLHIERIKKNNSTLIDFEIDDLEKFQAMLEVYGENQFCLYSWY
jgi:hypothetical protein